MSNSWIGTQNANRFQSIYLQGFLDISGGNVLLRNGGLTVNGNTILNNPLNTYSYDNVNFNSKIGNVWVNANVNDSIFCNQSIAISATGQYQVLAKKVHVFDDITYKGNIFVSNNYGSVNSWRDTNMQTVTSDAVQFQQVAISKNGQYVTVIARPNSRSDTIPTITFNIYVSSNFGSTFTTRNIYFVGYPTSVAVSFDGKYQTIVTTNTGTGYGYIYISSDYGNSFIQITSGVIRGFRSVEMSNTGKYQTAVPNTVPNSNMGCLLYTSDAADE